MYIVTIILLLLALPDPSCLSVWMDCGKDAGAAEDACTAECVRVHRPAALDAQAVCDDDYAGCHMRRFRACKVGPYGSNIPIRVCMEVTVPPMTWCWTEESGLGVPAACYPADLDGDGDVDLADFARMQLYPPGNWRRS